MKNGGAKRIFEVGELVPFRNPFSPDSVCAVLVESVKDGEIKGENIIITSEFLSKNCFIPEGCLVTIKQVIEPDPRIVNLISIHNVYRYIVEFPDREGYPKDYLLNEIFLESV